MGLSDLLLIVLLVLACVAVGVLIPLLLGVKRRLGGVLENLDATLTAGQRAVRNVEQLTQDILLRGLLDKVEAALASVEGGAARIEPITEHVQSALLEARVLLDDAVQTSQSVRARVDDLAATQKELHDLAGALADISTQLRDQELAVKVGHVLSDISVLIADVGLLTESAHAVLEGGRPLVENIGDVMEGAKRSVRRISSAIGGIREGVRAGVAELKD